MAHLQPLLAHYGHQKAGRMAESMGNIHDTCSSRLIALQGQTLFQANEELYRRYEDLLGVAGSRSRRRGVEKFDCVDQDRIAVEKVDIEQVKGLVEEAETVFGEHPKDAEEESEGSYDFPELAGLHKLSLGDTSDSYTTFCLGLSAALSKYTEKLTAEPVTLLSLWRLQDLYSVLRANGRQLYLMHCAELKARVTNTGLTEALRRTLQRCEYFFIRPKMNGLLVQAIKNYNEQANNNNANAARIFGTTITLLGKMQSTLRDLVGEIRPQKRASVILPRTLTYPKRRPISFHAGTAHSPVTSSPVAIPLTAQQRFQRHMLDAAKQGTIYRRSLDGYGKPRAQSNSPVRNSLSVSPVRNVSGSTVSSVSTSSSVPSVRTKDGLQSAASLRNGVAKRIPKTQEGHMTKSNGENGRGNPKRIVSGERSVKNSKSSTAKSSASKSLNASTTMSSIPAQAALSAVRKDDFSPRGSVSSSYSSASRSRSSTASSVSTKGNLIVCHTVEPQYDPKGNLVRRVRFLDVPEYKEEEDAPTPLQIQKQMRQRFAHLDPQFATKNKLLNSQEGLMFRKFRYMDLESIAKDHGRFSFMGHLKPEKSKLGRLFRK